MDPAHWRAVADSRAGGQARRGAAGATSLFWRFDVLRIACRSASRQKPARSGGGSEVAMSSQSSTARTAALRISMASPRERWSALRSAQAAAWIRAAPCSRARSVMRVSAWSESSTTRRARSAATPKASTGVPCSTRSSKRPACSGRRSSMLARAASSSARATPIGPSAAFDAWLNADSQSPRDAATRARTIAGRASASCTFAINANAASSLPQ